MKLPPPSWECSFKHEMKESPRPMNAGVQAHLDRLLSEAAKQMQRAIIEHVFGVYDGPLIDGDCSEVIERKLLK